MTVACSVVIVLTELKKVSDIHSDLSDSVTVAYHSSLAHTIDSALKSNRHSTMQIKGDQQLHTFLPTILALMHYCNNHTSCNNTHGDVYSK